MSTPAEVPDVVAEFAAEQVGGDLRCLKLYPDRLPTQHEHPREIRDRLGYRDFPVGAARYSVFSAAASAGPSPLEPGSALATISSITCSTKPRGRSSLPPTCLSPCHWP
ncbi:MAG: DUF4158 domain-containing protein [Pseudonocardiales bacterium]|nr:DUF4158 domain-containing protein [Pseudonocardiales bacterium]